MPERKKVVKRVDIKVKTLPYSLRAFIGKIMSNEAEFSAFAESPISALVKANVPIDARRFTKKDAERLVLIMGRIHAYVRAKRFAKDVKFEDVFNVVQAAGAEVAYVSAHSYSYTWTNITPDTHTRTRAHRGINVNFERDGIQLEQIGDILTTPLISPAELTEFLGPIEAEVNNVIRMG